MNVMRTSKPSFNRRALATQAMRNQGDATGLQVLQGMEEIELP
jgi:hypothetical protein